MRSHEDYIRDVASFVVCHADLNPTEQEELAAIKLVYGSGPAGTRGVTFYNRWQVNGIEQARPFVELSAFGQSSIVQLTGTTLHELGHVLAGWAAAHGKDWHAACERLGLLKLLAGGTDYQWEENFAPWVRDYALSIEPPDDGSPVRNLMGVTPGNVGFGLGFGSNPTRIKGCQAGIGTRGGKSRGTGSGSRLKLWQCKCGQKVRVAGTEFNATHNPCKSKFICQA